MLKNPRNDATLDISTKCTLKCSECARQHFETPSQIPGRNWTLEEFSKVISVYKKIDFNGQISDAVFNPHFIDMLKLCYKNGVEVEISNAASQRNMEWYERAFEANPNAIWIFGIDGLPDQSCIYRENQDGEHLFNVMLRAKELNISVKWQYIVFDYNRENIEVAKSIAKKYKIDIEFNYPTEARGGRVVDKKTKFVPKCLTGKRCTAVNATGHVLPCCWVDIPAINPKAELDDPLRLLFDNPTIFDDGVSVEQILQSDSYQQFMMNLINKKDVSWVCKKMCTSSLENPNRVKVNGTVSR